MTVQNGNGKTQRHDTFTMGEVVASNRIRRLLKLDAEHYDSGETTLENYKHWGAARDISVYQANNPALRRRLRVRARYEADNNSYCGGMVENHATDVIGSAPPQLHIFADDTGAARAIEDAWIRWSESLEVNLPSKLNVLQMAKTVEGEGFTLFFTDDEAENETGVSLNFNVLSPRRITDSTVSQSSVTGVVENNLLNDDGVFVSTKTGRPVKYNIMSNEDEINGTIFGLKDNTVNARFVTQWFKPKRPDQFRGISEIQAALPLFAYIRRYTLAMVSSAEIVASLTAFMKTQAVPSEGPTPIHAFSQFEFTRGQMNSIAEGWEPVFPDQKHPSSTYEMFINILLREVGRVLGMPFGVMLGDSSKYNYSSARLDYRGYDDKLKFDRKQLNVRELNIFYREWLREYVTTDSKIRQLIERNKIKHTWRYNSRPSIDPKKDADTEDVRLRNGTTTLQEVYADRGEDWEEALEQRKKEMEKVEELGLTAAFDYLIKEEVTNPDPTDTIPEDQLPFAEEE